MSNESKDAVNVKDGHGKKELARISINTSPERGVEFYIQSNQSCWQQFADMKNSFTLGGVKCFAPKQGNGAGLGGVNGHFNTNKDNFFQDGTINLSVLLAHSMKEGATFNFGVFPITEEKIDELLASMKQNLKMIYLQYCKPIRKTVIISTETVEVEEHD